MSDLDPEIQKTLLLEALKEGRVIIMSESGMLYYPETSGGKTWISNKPIQDIVFKAGWGLASLEFHIDSLGKTWFLSRDEAKAALEEGGTEGC